MTAVLGEHVTKSEEETFRRGFDLAETLKPGDIVLLNGELGAGKTRFAKGIAAALSIDAAKVLSPTYTIVHEFRGKYPMFHFDLYRLNQVEELYEIGFDEYLDRDAIVVIEWGSKFENYLPRGYYEVNFENQGENFRRIQIRKVEGE